MQIEANTTRWVNEFNAVGIRTRCRNKEDERVVIVKLTEEGENLKEKAVNIALLIANCISLEQEEAVSLYKLLNKMLKK